jgi:hypothetical protein
MNKRILRTKENEIAKAGKLVFDAIFGDDKELEQRLGKELDEEATDPPADPNAIDVVGCLVVPCSSCTREAVIPSHVDPKALELVGWRRVPPGDTWRCPMCAAKQGGAR